jgi:hypothetical protein
MVVWLSSVSAQTCSVVTWNNATIVRRLGDAAAPDVADTVSRPELGMHTLASALQLRTNNENLRQRIRKRSVNQRRSRFVYSTLSLSTDALTGMLTHVSNDFRVRRRCKPSVSHVSCRVVQRGVSHVSYLCIKSQLGR